MTTSPRGPELSLGGRRLAWFRIPALVLSNVLVVVLFCVLVDVGFVVLPCVSVFGWVFLFMVFHLFGNVVLE